MIKGTYKSQPCDLFLKLTIQKIFIVSHTHDLSRYPVIASNKKYGFWLGLLLLLLLLLLLYYYYYYYYYY